MKVLITGGSGRLGKYLVKEFSSCLNPTHTVLDITDRKKVFDFIKSNRPDIVVHLAAFVDVRLAEKEKELVWETNVIGTENLVNAILEYVPKSYFVYISTACVFRGDKGDYTENDIPYPINFYGLTKLIGEYIVKKLSNYIIIRTDFVERAKWKYEGAFIDRYSTCVFSDILSQEIKKVIDKRIKGLIHLTGKNKISHFQLARITTPEVKPIKLKDIDLPLPNDQSLKSVNGWNYIELR